MRPSRRLLATIALIMADSAWLYVAIALVGFISVRDNVPMEWPWVLAVLAAGGLTAAVGQSRLWRAAKAMAGVVTLYLAVAIAQDLGGFSPLWGLRFLQGGYSGGTIFSLVIVLLAAALLWRLGGLLATEPFLEERAVRHFRAGLIALAIALFFEVVAGADLGSATMLVPFFAASLAGMALARRPQVTGAGRGWVIILASAVVLAIGLGLGAGLLAGSVGLGGVGLLAAGWGWIAGAIGTVVDIVVVPILAVIFAGIAWLFDRAAGTLPEPMAQQIAEFFRPLQEEGQAPWDWPLDILGYILALLIVLLLYRALRPVVRRIRSNTQVEDEEELHESLRAEAKPMADLARLLGLLFGLTGGKEAADTWRTPSGEAGITEAFQLYFALLRAAMERGLELRPSDTPLERVAGLAAALPGAPVTAITRCFNGACYGRHPTAVETLDKLGHQLETAVKETEAAPSER